MGITRGCGQRVKGGCYAEVPLSPFGRPFEDFLLDPPIVIDPADYGLSPIGVKLVERNGIWHIMDWVGKQYYPNVADFVEEGERFGISRRLPKTLDFKKLTDASRLILLHERAQINNYEEFRSNRHCIKDIPTHGHPLPEMCIRLWWEDIQQGEDVEGTERDVVRKLPALEYEGLKRPEGVAPDYRLAIFGSFPIPRLAVIRDPEDNSHEETLTKAKAAGIPVILEDE